MGVAFSVLFIHFDRFSQPNILAFSRVIFVNFQNICFMSNFAIEMLSFSM